MVIMKYVFNNIRAFAKNETVIFVITVLCILVSSFILNFSYGLFRNYKTASEEKVYELTNYISEAPENTEFDMTVGELRQYVEALSSDTVGRITSIYCVSSTGALEEYDFPENFLPYIRSDTIYRNGEFLASSSNLETWKSEGYITEGRYFDDEEEKTGALVTVVPEVNANNKPTDIKIGDTITLFGQDYKIIGKHSLGIRSPKIPFVNIPKELKLGDFGFIFNGPITRSAYDDLKATADRVLPGKLAFPELQLPDDDTLSLYNNIILISAFVAVLSAMNFAMLYLFILDKRKNTLAVMCVCGARRFHVTMIYLCECLVLSAPSFAAGIFIFDILLKNVLKDFFPYMLEAFHPFIYFLIFAVYMVVMLVTMMVIISKSVSVNIKSCLMGGKI